MFPHDDAAPPWPLCRAAEIRALERHARAAGHTGLMERAGRAAAERARAMLGDGQRVLVLAGPGNNGGDAFVAARHLKAWWFDVTLVSCADPAKLPPDAARARAAWLACGGGILADIPPHASWQLAIDGLFGIGLQRPPSGPYARWIALLDGQEAPVLSLDVPSGLDGDTGVVRGMAVRASATVTFLALKPGLFTLDGPDHCGTLYLETLGAAPDGARGTLLDTGAARRLAPPPRPKNSHKGNFGRVAILGGADGMVGATLLAARAALHLGAGRVYAGLLAQAPPAVDFIQPELMLRSPAALAALEQPSVAVVGPGLGQTDTAADWLQHWLQCAAPLLLDADALNLLARDARLQERLAARAAPALLTPHPAEAARLLGVSLVDVQNDRVEAALELARRFGAEVALKGVGTVLASPSGAWRLNASGNPALASAGSGDVLAGMAAALLAQGLTPAGALALAVHLHGAAADALARARGGPLGITASALAPAAARQLNRWTRGRQRQA